MLRRTRCLPCLTPAWAAAWCCLLPTTRRCIRHRTSRTPAIMPSRPRCRCWSRRTPPKRRTLSSARLTFQSSMTRRSSCACAPASPTRKALSRCATAWKKPCPPMKRTRKNTSWLPPTPSAATRLWKRAPKSCAPWAKRATSTGKRWAAPTSASSAPAPVISTSKRSSATRCRC